MPSKELIALAATAMEERRKELIAQPLSRIYPQLAEAASGAILAALLEPTEAMLKEAHKAEDESAVHNYGSLPSATDYWDFMLAASALGEQSE